MMKPERSTGHQYARMLRDDFVSAKNRFAAPLVIARDLASSVYGSVHSPSSSLLRRAAAAKTDRGAAYYLACWAARGVARGPVPARRIRETADALIATTSVVVSLDAFRREAGK